MPKKKSLWARDCKCLVCETEVVNYQFMAKSQTIELDEWLIPHPKAVGEYEAYPSTLKTTICPSCLMATNEYGYGVDKYIYFTRNMARNSKLQEFFKTFNDERCKYLAEQFDKFHDEAVALEQKHGKPEKMRSRATLEKVWSLGGDYPKQYFKMMFEAPRDIVTTIALMAMDRYCQVARIAYEYDVEPPSWDYQTVYDAVCAHYDETKLDMKMAEPRFFYTAVNFMQIGEYLNELSSQMGESESGKYDDLKKEYLDAAFRWYRYSFNNDDVSAIPMELKDGGLNFILAKLYTMAQGTEDENLDQLNIHLRGARRYTDNTLKRISNTNQQNFVNMVDELWQEIIVPQEEAAAAEAAAAAAEEEQNKKKKKKK